MARTKKKSTDEKVNWRRIQSGRDPVGRDRLLTRYLPLVHHVAKQVQPTLVIETEFPELVSAGTIGLMHALESYDPDRGVAFSTYAVPRIRGAMLDDYRRRDPVPRSVRRKQRAIGTVRKDLARELGRPPRDSEVAEELEINVDTLTRWERQLQQAFPVSLDQPADPAAYFGARMEEILPGDTFGPVDEFLTRKEEVQIFRRELEKLNEQQKVVLTLYYLDELKIRDIADVMGVTASRISQIRLAGVETILSRLAHLRDRAA
jgi:RNA polymerase sigma factor for flagellar operon FliA